MLQGAMASIAATYIPVAAMLVIACAPTCIPIVTRSRDACHRLRAIPNSPFLSSVQ